MSAVDYDSIAKNAGSMLGSGAVIVMNDTTDMVQALRRISRFYFSESCSKHPFFIPFTDLFHTKSKHFNALFHILITT